MYISEDGKRRGSGPMAGQRGAPRPQGRRLQGGAARGAAKSFRGGRGGRAQGDRGDDQALRQQNDGEYGARESYWPQDQGMGAGGGYALVPAPYGQGDDAHAYGGMSPQSVQYNKQLMQMQAMMMMGQGDMLGMGGHYGGALGVGYNSPMMMGQMPGPQGYMYPYQQGMMGYGYAGDYDGYGFDSSYGGYNGQQQQQQYGQGHAHGQQGSYSEQYQQRGDGGQQHSRKAREHHYGHDVKAAEQMSDEDLQKATSPMLTRIIVDILREGATGKPRAWRFFERIYALDKADVYQYSVMLNACHDSVSAEKLMKRMAGAGVEPSEVTFQKLYKIFLRDARLHEADETLRKMNQLMEEDGNSKLPEDYTNRVLTDMLLEMVKEGHHAEERAWDLFNQLRAINKVNVIHYNVMINTCKTTEEAIKLVQQARQAGIAPSDRTCLKLAKMYIKEGNMPNHPSQLDAVMKGLKKTSLFSTDLTVDISPGPMVSSEQVEPSQSSSSICGPDSVLASPSTAPSPPPAEGASSYAFSADAVAKMVEQMLAKKPYPASGGTCSGPSTPTKMMQDPALGTPPTVKRERGRAVRSMDTAGGRGTQEQPPPRAQPEYLEGGGSE